MYAPGQTQKSECATGKSALPLTTGIVNQTCQSEKCQGQTSDIGKDEIG